MRADKTDMFTASRWGYAASKEGEFSISTIRETQSEAIDAYTERERGSPERKARWAEAKKEGMEVVRVQVIPEDVVGDIVSVLYDALGALEGKPIDRDLLARDLRVILGRA